MPGVEQTPNILWFDVPGRDVPEDGRPLQLLAARARTRPLPRNGAPWDELREPGQMMDDIERGCSARRRACAR